MRERWRAWAKPQEQGMLPGTRHKMRRACSARTCDAVGTERHVGAYVRADLCLEAFGAIHHRIHAWVPRSLTSRLTSRLTGRSRGSLRGSLRGNRHRCATRGGLGRLIGVSHCGGRSWPTRWGQRPPPVAIHRRGASGGRRRRLRCRAPISSGSGHHGGGSGVRSAWRASWRSAWRSSGGATAAARLPLRLRLGRMRLRVRGVLGGGTCGARRLGEHLHERLLHLLHLSAQLGREIALDLRYEIGPQRLPHLRGQSREVTREGGG